MPLTSGKCTFHFLSEIRSEPQRLFVQQANQYAFAFKVSLHHRADDLIILMVEFSLKPYLPLILTFVLPRAITYYRTIKTAIRTRPPARPLPSKTGRGLNVLFCSICLFLFWSMPFGSVAADRNIFVVTNARLHVPTDVLFSRLAMIRPLTPFDDQLRSKITTPKYVVCSWFIGVC